MGAAESRSGAGVSATESGDVVGATESRSGVGATESGAVVGTTESSAILATAESGAVVGATETESHAVVGVTESGAVVNTSEFAGAGAGATELGAGVGAAELGAGVGATESRSGVNAAESRSGAGIGAMESLAVVGATESGAVVNTTEFAGADAGATELCAGVSAIESRSGVGAAESRSGVGATVSHSDVNEAVNLADLFVRSPVAGNPTNGNSLQINQVGAPDVMADPWVPGVQWSSRKNKMAVYFSKTSPFTSEEVFFKSQSLGTTVEPQCGGCLCSKCPIPGSKYSFLEQREFDIINKNLFRKDNVWYTEYPWCCSRDVLPKNDKMALQNLLNLERMLAKNQELADDFSKQIDAMVERGSAVILSERELKEWEGDYHYIPLVGVKGKKKWLRICFDASRKQGGYPSLNSCLYKGPDRFVNNVLSVIMGFRNGRVGAVADISKFHNRVRLVKEDCMMQRFLWRGMDRSIEPRTYAVVVNNFGVKPANCIATCALHQSADLFAERYPIASQEIKDQTYVDDELTADTDMDTLREKTRQMDEITEHAGMPNKGWLYGGDASNNEVTIGSTEEDAEKVLGLLWLSEIDAFGFRVVLQFPDPDKTRSGKINISSLQDFDNIISSIVLTLRIVLANVARVFDPAGNVCPVTLKT